MSEDGDAGRLDGTKVPVAVVGGGQAGLAVSWHVSHHGIEHLVVERHRVGYDWRERRWDSFCLVTPNWQCQLPGFPYPGDDPDGFMDVGGVISYLEEYAARTQPPLVEGVSVRRLRGAEGGGYELLTSEGKVRADQVVVATGPYNRPVIPAVANSIPAGITSLHSSEYRRPADLPSGAVLVVGSGQSGCQIAEDLHLAGRQVHLAVGSAPRVARRYRGKDVVLWLEEMGYYRTTIDDHPLGEGARRNVNHYLTGRDGGHDIDLRAFALEGMRLHGRLTGAEGATLRFADDLGERLDHADHVSESIKDSVDRFIGTAGVAAPEEARYRPVWQPPVGPTSLPLEEAGVGAVVWSTGFRPDHSWIDLPIFDGAGRAVHSRGVTPADGVYIVGLPWLHTWGSARFSGIAADTEHVAAAVAAEAAGDRLRRSA